MKRYMKLSIFFLLLRLVLGNTNEARALTVKTDESGNYYWKLIDTKKTSDRSWSTEGYTVKAEKCLPEGKPQKGKYGTHKKRT